jgi:hypothetical protein
MATCQPPVLEVMTNTCISSRKLSPRRARPLVSITRCAPSILPGMDQSKESLRNLGIGPVCFSARLRISPGEIPNANARRPKVSMEGVVLPCSRYVMKERANPVRTESSFFERPRVSRSLVSSVGNAFFKRSAHSSAPMARYGESGSGGCCGSIFRSCH